jgi:beta-lactam-binding protein with PASTA domain
MLAKKSQAYTQLLFCLLIVFFLSAVVSSRVIQKGEIVSIPDISGKTLAEAEKDLARKRLSLQEKGVEFSDRYERGKIISGASGRLQDPGQPACPRYGQRRE